MPRVKSGGSATVSAGGCDHGKLARSGTFDDELRAIGGVWGGFGKGFSGTLIWDGVDLHPTVEFSYRRHIFTFLWVALEDPGVAYSIAL